MLKQGVKVVVILRLCNICLMAALHKASKHTVLKFSTDSQTRVKSVTKSNTTTPSGEDGKKTLHIFTNGRDGRQAVLPCEQNSVAAGLLISSGIAAVRKKGSLPASAT